MSLKPSKNSYIPNWVKNISVSLMSLFLCFIVLEIVLRIVASGTSEALEMNNFYRYVERIGQWDIHLPYYSYQERVPLEYDHHNYYRATNGLVNFHTNQFGARWTSAGTQDLKPARVIVLGDSFTFGHGLYCEDSYVYRLEQALQSADYSISFLNFARRGADAEQSFQTYNQFKDSIPHDAVLYGVHINDFALFPTSFMAGNPIAIPEIAKYSKAFTFITQKVHHYFIRKQKIDYLNSELIFNLPFFEKNMKAFLQLQKTVEKKGLPMKIVLLPVLFDLKKETLQPLYNRIKKKLDQYHLDYIDLTNSLNKFDDQKVWVLPFDQHPNKLANQIFADLLLDRLKPFCAELICHPVQSVLE